MLRIVNYVGASDYRLCSAGRWLLMDEVDAIICFSEFVMQIQRTGKPVMLID